MKKGFTLIELLAVIVILGIIAVITTPLIMGVIEDARKSAALSSAQGYVEAVEQSIMESELDLEGENLSDGTYEIETLKNIEYKGKGPTQGYVEIKDMEVVSAHLCVNDHSIDYDGIEAKESESSYCKEEPTLTIIKNGESTKQELGKVNNTEILLEDATNIKSISCNNGTSVTIEENTLKLEHIYGDTICRVDNSLEDSVNHLDHTKTTIIMMNDTEVESTLTFKENSNVKLDLNGKKIVNSGNTTRNIIIKGIMRITSTKPDGAIEAKTGLENENHLTLDHVKIKREAISDTDNSSAIFNHGYMEVNDGTYIEGPHGIGHNNVEGAMLVINGGTIKGTVHSGISIDHNYGTGIIRGGTIIGTERGIQSVASNLVIEQTDKPIYISSLSEKWFPAIWNNGTGTITITGHQANECTSDASETTSGLCVCVGTNNGAVQNSSTGTININGGTYIGGSQGINNNATGMVNIRNAYITAHRAVLNNSGGIIRICNSNISGEIDLQNTGSGGKIGNIYYSSNVIFTSGNNTPKTGGQTANIQLSEEAC